MSELLKGKPVAEKLSEKMKEDVAFLKAKGITPTLALLRVGEKDSDLSYERGALKRCDEVGVEVRKYVFPEDVDADTFFAKLEELNNDDSVHGILMFRPLPKSIGDEKARMLLNPDKDIDGSTDGSLAGVFTGQEKGFAPCTAQAVMEILDYYGIDVCGKKVAVLGRSLVIGRPVAMLLMHKGATPAICHSKTVNAEEITKSADIVIAAVGKTESIGEEYFGDDQVVIDVGINWNEEKQKLCGDVDFDKVEPKVKAITPVPGGVGAVTTCVLISHVVEAAKRKLR